MPWHQTRFQVRHVAKQVNIKYANEHPLRWDKTISTACFTHSQGLSDPLGLIYTSACVSPEAHQDIVHGHAYKPKCLYVHITLMRSLRDAVTRTGPEFTAIHDKEKKAKS